MQSYFGDLPTEGVRLPTLVHAERKALTWNQVQAIAAVIGFVKAPAPGVANAEETERIVAHLQAY